MPDDIFDDISRWWRPQIGRGLFSNWFLTERERDIRELEALYERVDALYNVSPLLEDDAPIDTVIDIVTNAYKRSEIGYSRGLIAAFCDPLKALLIEEIFGLPLYKPGEIAKLRMPARVELRAYLLRKECFFAEFDRRFAIAKQVLADVVLDIFDEVVDEGLIEIEDEDAHVLTLDLPLTGLLADVPSLTERTLNTFCSERSASFRAELFLPLREQFMRSLSIATGIDPDGPPSDKPFLMPTDAKRLTPAEMVDTYLGCTPFYDLFEASVPITVSDSVRSEHALIVGGSGHGKSQLLLKLIHHDLTHGGETPPGVIVIDSQGDLIQTVSRLALFDPDAADSLADRLILIDPADVEFPVALNLFAFDQSRLEGYSRADRERVLNSVIDLYEYFFSALLGAELTQKQGVVFRYLARLMLVIPDATVQTLRELMEDGRPFKKYMGELDGSAKRFFATEFFSPGFSATKKQILRRLWGVLANPVFERMFSHPENRLDLFEAMNEGKIVLINTAKDLLKAEGCSIFGRFFIAKIAQGALERATIPEEERRTTYVYIDEAHDYFDETLEQLFNQARKYRVGLHIAAQHLEQMPVKLRSTVMASTSLKFAGGVSSKDARALADDMRTDADFIRSMRKRHGRSEFAAYVKNRTETAVRMNIELGHVNARPSLGDEQYQTLINRNRARYCATIEEVEAIIAKSDAGTPIMDVKAERPTRAPRSETPTAPAAEQPPPDPSPVREEPPSDPAPPEPAPAEPVAEREPAERPEVPKDRQPEIDRYVAGVGGRQHTLLQQLVRKLAQERNFKATVEKPVLGGAGSVDVALEHEKLSIGVEISVTTDLAHEQRNVEKCFKAGFDEVFLVVPDPEKRAKHRRHLTQVLSASQAEKVLVLGPDELAQALSERAAELATTEQMVRGWRVTTRYKAVSEEDAHFRRQTVAKILVQSARGETPED